MKNNARTRFCARFHTGTLPTLVALFALLVGLSCMHVQAQESAPDEAGESSDYRLQTGDSISMTVYQESDIALSATIGKSAAISFPLIGQVDIRGLTVPELEQKLRNLYMMDYYVDPKVRVLITGYHTKHFHVSGAVETPGRYTYPEEGVLNLGQAVAMSGGVDETGDIKAITIFKSNIAGFKTYDLASQGDHAIAPNDTILVPRLPSVNVSYVATVSGEVNKPGYINIGPAKKIDILTALAQAGGFSRIANQKEGIIQRKTEAGYRTETVGLKDISNGKAPMVFLEEGDILIIKESRW